MATQVTNTATLNSTQLRTFYTKVLLGRLLPQLTYTLYGQQKPMPSNSGQTVNFRRFSSLAAATTPLTEGVTPSGNALTANAITASPSQYGDFIEISDLLDFTAPDPILAETVGLQGEQAALTIDTVVRDVIMAGTTVQYAGTSHTARNQITTSDKISTAEIRKAVRTLHQNKVPKVTSVMDAQQGIGTQPIAGGYIAIIGPETHYDLKAVAEFVPVHEYPSQNGLLPFEVGALDEVRFVMTQNSKVFAAAGASGQDIHATIIMGGGFFGVIAPLGVQSVIKDFGAGQDPLNQRATAGWKAYFTAVILQQLAAVRLEHSVS